MSSDVWVEPTRCPGCGTKLTGQPDLGLQSCPTTGCGWTNEGAVIARGEIEPRVSQADIDLLHEERVDEPPGGQAAERPGEFG